MSETRICDVLDKPKPYRNLRVESLFEYGARCGFFRLRDLLCKYDLPCTVFAVGRALQLSPAVCHSLVELKEQHNWELATHALRWVDYRYVKPFDELQQMNDDFNTHLDCLAGNIARGYYGGMPQARTNSHVFQNDHFFYTSDCYNDDKPQWLFEEGEDTPGFTDEHSQQLSTRRPLLAIPYSLVNNDMRTVCASRHSPARVLVDEIMEGVKQLVRECEENNESKMMSIGLHCRVAGLPQRAAQYARLFQTLSDLQKEKKIVVQTRWEICKNMYRNHYPSVLTTYELQDADYNQLRNPSTTLLYPTDQ
eukprot:GHVH01003007.1.p1 GENE.GHVH01003007.1~~GHVH01003007.1.p1  ORF type:complete len:308 (+),score=28.59 GHVH01003007.1:379-1302(+)